MNPPATSGNAYFSPPSDLPKYKHRSASWATEPRHRFAVVGSRDFAETLSLIADVANVDLRRLQELPRDIEAIIVVPSSETGESISITDTRGQLSHLLAQAKSQNIRVDLYDYYDLVGDDEINSVVNHFGLVLTSSHHRYERWLKHGLSPDKAALLPFPVSHALFNPINSEEAPRHGLVYFKGDKRKIPVVARRALSGASSSSLVTRIFEYDTVNGAVNSGIELQDKLVHRVDRVSDRAEFRKVSRNFSFAICDETTPAQDQGGVGVLGHLAQGTIVFSDYNKTTNGSIPSVAMVETGEDLRSFVDGTPDAYHALARLDGIRFVYGHCTVWDWLWQYAKSAFGQHPDSPKSIVVTNDYRKFEDFTNSQTARFEFQFASDEETAHALLAHESGLIIYLDRIPFVTPNTFADLQCALRYSSATHLEICAADDPRHAYQLRDSKLEDTVHAIWKSKDSAPHKHILIRTDELLSPNVLNRENPGVLAKKELTIVIPVFNNGKHLLFKSLQSLWRESIQDIACIQIVDDGSTDPETRHILELLEDSGNFLEIIRLPEGGSGSAARPRNAAMNQLRTPYVTFLDPDDEQIGSGYYNLLRKIIESQADIVVGNTVVRRGGRAWVGNVPNIEKGLQQLGLQSDSRGRYSLGGDNRDLLSAIRYQPFSIQATVARTDFLDQFKLRQVEGAFGEDSLFSLQMLHAARSIAFERSSIFVYNAEVPGSAVNSISVRFFEKSLKAELSQVEWLHKLGLTADYSNKRFMKMLNVWYLQKINELKPHEQLSGLKILHSIAELYGSEVTGNDEYREAMSRAGLDV
ncbi:glycosyltransferase family 2 protein [Brevibacterium sp. UMB1308A]|uniref:glycosyltransferase family 2 protein n=1 Tax=Brevibacterium sp. UMB1308A TaxID=3050608 RepID=UPI00254DE324|nr:glycosyltransferase family 2 protein [Brevibacterium sp. UMB1308A]MDK8346585.1 glycosyltransferase family 2 protein [Brevibacterium sp. UMB1308B]MDK8713494.1 glycosyltransferase family 2 protein [Brevibacterium sp. UMB1308A]